VTVECLLGLLVWTTRRPVRLVFSREESFIGHGKRHPYVLRYRTGATRSGELVARSDSPRQPVC
jgi:nicotinate dehydrogenase large molybdopterin subunit